MNKYVLGILACLAAGCGDIATMPPEPDSGLTLYCETGQRFDACSTLRCPDGSEIITERLTCVSGGLVCLPVAHMCPTHATDGGTTTDTGVTPDMSDALILQDDGPAGGTIFSGQVGTHFQHTTFRALRDVRMEPFDFYIEVRNAEGALTDQLGNPFVRNIRLVNLDNNDVLATAINLAATPNARVLHARFTEAIELLAGQQLRLGLLADTVELSDSSSMLGTRFRVVAGSEGHYFAPNAVRNRDGSPIDPNAIVNNRAIEGNEFVLRKAGLSLDLLTDPRSAVIPRNSLNAPSAGISCSANAGSDIHMRHVRLSCVGDTGGGFRPMACHNVITSCRATDGATPIAVAMSPDSTNGFMDLTMSYVIRRGTTRSLLIECTPDSIASLDGDRFAIGIANASDVEATDDTGTNILAAVSLRLQQQLSAPTVVQTVVNSGVLHVYQGRAPIARYVDNNDPDAWHPVATYRLATGIEDANTSRFSAHWEGPTGCVNNVAIAYEGRVYGSNTVSGDEHDRDILLDRDLLVVPRGIQVQIWARFTPFSTPERPTSCFPTESTTLTFSLSSGLTDGKWSAAFDDGGPRGRANIWAVGAVSGSLMVPEESSPVGDTIILR